MLSLLLLINARAPFSFGILGEELWFPQVKDHFEAHSLNQTFLQRYFVNTTFSGGNSTNLIVYIGGESELKKEKVTSGAIIDLAKQTESTIVALEHRFFGKSYIPGVELDAENLAKYLTVEQALSDLSNFINFSRSKYCTGENCTVLVVGGSYPGTLSSWFRLDYPHMANASWASSAPIRIKNNFSEYDLHCAEQLETIHPKCRPNLQSLFELYTKYYLTNISRLRTTIEKFGWQDVTSESFLYIVADIIAHCVQYKQHQYLLHHLCDTIEYDKYDETVAALMNNITDIIGASYKSFDPLNAEGDGLMWTWMTCNQVGWFQTASGKLRSPLVNLSYFNDTCMTLFNISIDETERLNIRYGGDHPRATNVYYVNGAVDPWSRVSIHETDQLISQYSIVIDGEAHCADLHDPNVNDSEYLTNARALVIEKMKKWMLFDGKCVHGTLINHVCKCDIDYTGEHCEEKFLRQRSFKIITILATVVPTLLLLVIGFSIWNCGKHEESEFGARPTLYT